MDMKVVTDSHGDTIIYVNVRNTAIVYSFRQMDMMLRQAMATSKSGMDVWMEEAKMASYGGINGTGGDKGDVIFRKDGQAMATAKAAILW